MEYAYGDLSIPAFVFGGLISKKDTDEGKEVQEKEKKEYLSPFLSQKDGDVYYSKEEHRTVCGFPQGYENFLF
jgi:hypothetical protein